MAVCAHYEDVIDYAHQAILADRRMFEAKVQELEVNFPNLIMTMFKHSILISL